MQDLQAKIKAPASGSGFQNGGICVIRIMEIKGIPVICMKDDSRIGYIDVPVYNKDGSVAGFFAEIKGVLWGRRFIDIRDVLKIDGKACVIYSEKNVKKRREAGGVRSGSKQKKLLGKKVMLRGGGGIGVVRDLMFNTETGEIEGVEVSRGVYDDLSRGRRALLLRDCAEIGEDGIVVSDEGELL